MAEKIDIITLYDFTIKTNTLYEVVEKYDANAPQGFKKYETTKALDKDIQNLENVAVFNSMIGGWDTGLYAESPLLNMAIPSEETRNIVLKQLEEYITEPIERVRGKGALRSTEDNNTFWDNLQVEVFKGKVFNTSDPMQLLQLYLLILRRALTPQEHESHPNFINSQYCILDKELVMDKENEQALRIVKAYSLYGGLRTSSKSSLLAILNYLNFNVDENVNDSSLDLMFKRFIEHKKDGIFNIKEFIQVSEEYSTKEGKNIINFYQQLKEMYANGLVELRGKEVYIDGEYIGSSFKNAAMAINQNKDVRKIFTSKLQ